MKTDEHNDLPVPSGPQGDRQHEPSGSGSGGTEGSEAAGVGAAEPQVQAADSGRGGRRNGRKYFVDQAKAERIAGEKGNRANRKETPKQKRLQRSRVASNNVTEPAAVAVAKQPRKKPVRHVWGRVRVVVGGERVTFELTKDGLRARRWHQRAVRTLSFEQLAIHTRYQGLLFKEGV